MRTATNPVLAPPLLTGASTPRLTVQEAADLSRRHPVTIYRALETEALHGAQAVKGGRWLIRVECLDAWIDSTSCEHQAADRAAVITLADRRGAVL